MLVYARPPRGQLDTSDKMADVSGQNDLLVDNSKGETVTIVAATVDATRMHMSVPLPSPLPVGTYTVRWYTVGEEDRHPAQGKWTFTFDPAAKPAQGTPIIPPAGAASSQSGGSLLAAGTGVALVVVALGGVAFARRRRRRA